MEYFDAAIIGGGPAGIMAATVAASRGKNTILLDKNQRLGVKILLSGGSRCNLTHDCDARGIIAAFGRSGQFLHSALAAFGPADILKIMHAEGVRTVVEPETGKIFPASDRAADVLAALLRRLKQSGATVACEETIMTVRRAESGFVVAGNGRDVTATSVLIATGGQSYPDCGTTGDGFRFAAELGHTIVTPRPALAPIVSHADWVTELQGVSVPDAAVCVIDPNAAAQKKKVKPLAASRGALLFAHFGVSGPAVLDVSRAVSLHPHPQQLRLECDLAPSISLQACEEAIERRREKLGKKQVAYLLDQWVSHRLSEAVVMQAEIDGELRAADLNRDGRARLALTLKALPIPVVGTMGFRKAEVTTGGVDLREVDSRDMQSKIVPGLFFAGETLDLDGPIGGYNFQAAFSTGYLAGLHL